MKTKTRAGKKPAKRTRKLTDPVALQLGELADKVLARQNLFLTQGGEPTFVPINPVKPEWNSEALGEEKLFLGRRLARNFCQILLPGSVIIQSFGKRFPGEALPRWRLGIYRAQQKAATWSNLDRLLLDQENAASATPTQARDLLSTLAAELNLTPPLEAFEDAEQILRFRPELRDCLPKFSRAVRTFTLASRKVSAEENSSWFEPAGWVLPLDFQEGRWISSAWNLPGNELTLLPGESPIGLRLPLDQLAPGNLRLALTVEVKQNQLWVFLPPLANLNAFLELIQKIESLAAKLSLPPLVLQGYPPEFPEMEQISLMADPGVLEVNLPPCGDWKSFSRLIRNVYQAADRSELRGYKLQFNGRKVSTGGGAHIVLGGPSLEKNPFIQRPHLLSSFLRFVQNHPSLSYLFTGLFTGPSSQAPRVDESSCQIPYELEISLKAIETMTAPADPAMLDAILRNLLLDAHGNTHRAEISVDKFYSAVAPNGRLGLVEFRAFEMMPDAGLFLPVNLLIRCLAAAFSEHPYRHPLIDWRQSLHDKFALPFFLKQDLALVLDWLKLRGFSFDLDWFEPHRDFRFPLIRQWKTGAARWELRQALETWPVMGDGTVSRSVDATTDRLELTVRLPQTAVRWKASVNGIRIPLRPSEQTLVAAIRYRQFTNIFGLQPQIGAQTPLQFEIIDGTGRVVEAFDYLNWKPGGGGYTSLPLTESEARQRVKERIVVRMDRLNQRTAVRSVRLSPCAPFTLDLRAWQ